MALARQNFTLKFGQGLDTKTDPKQVDVGKLIELENATFQSTNRLTKRPGTEELAATTKPAQGNAIASYRDELVVMDGKSLYSYGKQFDNLISKGTKAAISVTAESIIKNSYQQTSPDSCLLNGLSAYAWDDSQGGVHYSVFDNVTQQLILSNQEIAGASTPKVVRLGTKIAILYIESGATDYLKAHLIDSTAPTAAPTTITLYSSAAGVAFYDASTDSTGGYVYFAVSNDNGDLQVARVSDTNVVTGPISLVAGAGRVAMVLGAFGNYVVGYSTSTAIRYVTVDAAVTTLGSPVTIETIAGVVNLTAIETTATNFKWYYEIDATEAYNHHVRTNTVSAGTPGTPADFNRSVGLWSKPFVYSGTHYIALVHESDLQDTYFVFNAAGEVVTKIAPDNGGNLSSNGTLREVNVNSANSFEFSYLIKDLVESVGGDVFTQTGVNSAVLVFQRPLLSEPLGNNLNISGGVVSAYDGQNVVEQNFHLYPENVTADITSSGGRLNQGQYQYVATYEWTDAQGQIHLSSPSVPVTVDTVLGNDYYTVNSYSSIPGLISVGTPVCLWFRQQIAYYDIGKYKLGSIVNATGIPVNTFTYDTFPVALFSGGGNYYFNFYALLSNSPTSFPTNPTVTQLQQKRFIANSTIGSKTIRFDQAAAGQYSGRTTAGSNVIELTNATGVMPGMYVYSAGQEMWQQMPARITAVSGKNITTTRTFAFDADNLTVLIGNHNYSAIGRFAPGTNYVDFDTGGYPTDFAVGQKVYIDSLYLINNTLYFAVITSFTQISANVWRLFLNITNPGPFTVGNFLYLGMTQYFLFEENKEYQVTGSFVSPVKMTNITKYSADFDTEASATAQFQIYDLDGVQATVNIPTLRITDKPLDTPVSIAVYRTLVNETLFYRVSRFDQPILNDKTIDSVSFSDNTADSELIGNEQLYTTGGVLANGPSPASNLLTQYRNRLIAVSSEDPFTWYFSKPVGTGVPVQFSPFFYKKIPEFGGQITALGVMDDKLIFFKRSSIFIVVGSGPNNLGLQDDFNDAELVTTDTGCSEPKSVVRMPLGLMYKSAKGIYLLNRGLNVEYRGAPVEAYNNVAVTSSELIESVNQVRFTLETGVTLVYDYFFDQWSAFTNQNAVDSTIFDSKFVYLRPDGKIYKESSTSWTDGGLPIYLKAKTAWLSFNGLQGLERIYNAMVLGEYKSPHTLTFQVAHDFAAASQTTVIPSTVSPGLYQYKVYLTRQKSQAVQFILQESQAGPTYGEGLSISAVSLEVGVKKGLNTLPAGKLYG